MVELLLRSKITALLQGLHRPHQHVSPNNHLVNSFLYGIDDIDPKHPVSKGNKIIHADFGKVPPVTSGSNSK